MGWTTRIGARIVNGDPATHPTHQALDYRSLLERIPAVTYVAGFGESGAWTDVSPQIEEMLGFPPGQWMADPSLWFRQIHPDDKDGALEEESQSKATGQPLHSEYRMMCKDGMVRWIRDEAVLVRDDHGEPLYWEGFMFDITARRGVEQALHESEARYRSVFDHVPVGLYRTTPDGRLLDGNRALAAILGFPNREAMLAADAHDFYLDPSDREHWMSLMESEGVVRDFEMQIRRADGGVIWVRDSGRAVLDRDERVLHYEGVLEDTTRRKQAEWEARQANQQLSGWIGELEQRNKEMSLINEMGDFLQSCPTADEAYAVIGHWAGELFPGRSGAVFAISPSRNLVEPVATWGAPTLGEQVFGPEECWALRSGRVHQVDDPSSRLLCRHLSEPVNGSVLCVPMMAQGEALGVLHLQLGPEAAGRPGARSGRTVDSVRQLAVAVSEHLSLALANLKLRETLRTQSIRDPLTGLFNRRYMEESLERELRRAERRGHPVGVIMIDLDHFNHFNNTFGHQAGDSLLQAFGELLRTRVRSEDIACRYGGEEFTLIMPEAPPEVVLRRADQLREEVRDLRVSLRGQALGMVTASMGVAVFPIDAGAGPELIREADRALYQAKEEGRDRVIAASVVRDQESVAS